MWSGPNRGSSAAAGSEWIGEVMSQPLEPSSRDSDDGEAARGTDVGKGSGVPDNPPPTAGDGDRPGDQQTQIKDPESQNGTSPLGNSDDPGDQQASASGPLSAEDPQRDDIAADHGMQQPSPGVVAPRYDPLLEVPRWIELVILVSGLILVIGTTAAQILLPVMVEPPNGQPAEAYTSRKLNTTTYVITLLLGSLFILLAPFFHGVEAELRRRDRRYLEDLKQLPR
jgi:hypothetical protein